MGGGYNRRWWRGPSLRGNKRNLGTRTAPPYRYSKLLWLQVLRCRGHSLYEAPVFPSCNFVEHAHLTFALLPPARRRLQRQGHGPLEPVSWTSSALSDWAPRRQPSNAIPGRLKSVKKVISAQRLGSGSPRLFCKVCSERIQLGKHKVWPFLFLFLFFLFSRPSPPPYVHSGSKGLQRHVHTIVFVHYLVPTAGQVQAIICTPAKMCAGLWKSCAMRPFLGLHPMGLRSNR